MRVSVGLVVGWAVLAGGPLEAQSAEGARTIGLIAGTLKRFGEVELAKRLEADYKAERVKFGKLYDYGVIENLHDTAEVKAGRGGWGDASTNTMTINARYEATSRAGERPERRASSLVSLASTMVHEYVHMGQNRPAHTAAYEEPATRAQEEAIGRWLDHLEREAREAREASGGDRANRMEEVKGLLLHLESELGGLKDLTAKGVEAGFIQAKTAWRWDELIQRAREVRALASAPQSSGQPAGTWSGTWKTNFGPLAVPANQVVHPSRSGKLKAPTNSFQRNSDEPPQSSKILPLQSSPICEAGPGGDERGGGGAAGRVQRTDRPQVASAVQA